MRPLSSYNCGAGCYCGCQAGYYCASAGLCGCGNARGCRECVRCPAGTYSVGGWFEHYEQSVHDACMEICPDGYAKSEEDQACYLCDQEAGPDKHLGPAGSCDPASEETEAASTTSGGEATCEGQWARPAPRGGALTVAAEGLWSWRNNTLTVAVSHVAVQGSRVTSIVVEVDGCFEQLHYEVREPDVTSEFVEDSTGACINDYDITVRNAREILSACPVSDLTFKCDDERADEHCAQGADYVLLRLYTALQYKKEAATSYGSVHDPNAAPQQTHIVVVDTVPVPIRYSVMHGDDVDDVSTQLGTYALPYVLVKEKMSSTLENAIDRAIGHAFDTESSEEALIEDLAVVVPHSSILALGCAGSEECRISLEAGDVDARLVAVKALTTTVPDVVDSPYDHPDLRYTVFALRVLRPCDTVVDGTATLALEMPEGDVQELPFVLLLTSDCPRFTPVIPTLTASADFREALTYEASGKFTLPFTYTVTDEEGTEYDAEISGVVVHMTANGGTMTTVLMDHGSFQFSDPEHPLHGVLSVDGSSMELAGDFAAMSLLGAHGAPSGVLAVTVTLSVSFVEHFSLRRRLFARRLAADSRAVVEAHAEIPFTATGAVTSRFVVTVHGPPSDLTVISVNRAILEVAEVPGEAVNDFTYSYDEAANTTSFSVRFAGFSSDVPERLMSNRDALCSRLMCADNDSGDATTVTTDPPSEQLCTDTSVASTNDGLCDCQLSVLVTAAVSVGIMACGFCVMWLKGCRRKNRIASSNKLGRTESAPFGSNKESAENWH